MSARLGLAAVTLLVAGLIAHAGDRPDPDKLVIQTYAVADLVVPLQSSNEAKAETMEKNLIKMIVNTISPTSWQSGGGQGTVEYFPLSMSLVITQRPDIQENVAELLTALRRVLDTEVVSEVRFLSVPESFFDKLGADFDLPKAEGATKGLTDAQVFQLLE